MVDCMQRLTGRKTLIAAMVGALAVVLASGSPAGASTVAGRITGVPIPTAGTGEAFVRAVSLLTGEVIAVDATDAAGRYG